MLIEHLLVHSGEVVAGDLAPSGLWKSDKRRPVFFCWLIQSAAGTFLFLLSSMSGLANSLSRLSVLQPENPCVTDLL